MKTIPEIRERLGQIALVLVEGGVGDEEQKAFASELFEMFEGLKRRSPCRVARRSNKRMRPEDHQKIRDLAAAYPDSSYQELSAMSGYNTGRISEALAGKRQEA